MEASLRSKAEFALPLQTMLRDLRMALRKQLIEEENTAC